MLRSFITKYAPGAMNAMKAFSVAVPKPQAPTRSAGTHGLSPNSQSQPKTKLRSTVSLTANLSQKQAFSLAASASPPLMGLLLKADEQAPEASQAGALAVSWYQTDQKGAQGPC